MLVLRIVLLCLMAAAARAAEPVRYNRDIRPILSDKCFFCHGFDEKKRESGLRLDTREGALKKNAIVPGKPAQSELLKRVTTKDAGDHMPPAKSKLASLTTAEVELLRRWIAEGAPYEAHWAFVPLSASVQSSVFSNQSSTKGASGKASALKTENWSLNTSPIDQLVSRQLASRKLKLQPEADPATLLRRLSFDLTGLPPTPAEVEAFLREYSPIGNRQSAIGNLVDRLLASPHYGERMAVDWLDISRYADSYGFQVDREREMWPWRDWVIKSFNENLPFDKFVTAQLAGDLLPNPTDDQILATAFNRLHQQETEGGSVEEEYRVEYVADRVQTFATAFLGLTFECARCHDHKYDPIAQKEYYGLFSFFQNIDEAGLYSYFTPSAPTPAQMLLDAPAKEKLAALEKSVREAGEKLAATRKARSAAFSTWLKNPTRPTALPRSAGVPPAAATSQTGPRTSEPASPAQPLRPGVPRSEPEAIGPHSFPIPGELARYTFDALIGNKFTNALGGTNSATLVGDNKLVPGRSGQAVQFTGDEPVNLPLGNFQRHEPFSVSLWLRTPDVKDRAVVFHRSQAWTDAGSRGYELLIEDGRLKWSLIHFWPGNAASIKAVALVPTNAWTHVVVTSDGSSRADGLRLYVNGQPVASEIIKDSLTKNITGGGHDNISLAERMRDRGFKGGAIDDFRVFGRALTPFEAAATHDEAAAKALLAKSEAQLSASERAALEDYFLATVDAEFPKQLAALKAARAELVKFADGVKEIMVMRELAQPKQSYVLWRGEYNHRRDPVGPITPAALSPWPADAPRNRLGLAQWLTAPDHPLLARVTVNRIWQSLFGRGLVKTSEDFGSQGEKPLYPEMLDWLSLRFIQSGWDTKALMKTIVMSGVYRQRSLADAKTMADDPDNQWLARGPRLRLPAEMIRDNALAAAGLLKPTLGGPPVNPYEMSESFKPASPTGGDGVYRRSLYTNWRRTGPPPALLAFDAPRRAVCTAKRERTDSPLQALILLNGTQYVEAARVLGESLHRDAKGDVPAMIEAGFLRCLSRKPDAKELVILQQLHREQLDHFKAKPAEAESLLKTGNTKRDEKISAPEAGAATVLAQALLNHDACVVKR
ncbi:MAG: hypothetical protein FD161_919 [Limisphaerales bacterium]|nr:MAG: hypothetical protein FD161_919 [Limisphaerales bacterium]KAG0509901.1 MAG: hypothetical protein E1N63_919 [Limisphaerales bacterium]TXT50628.1 MAG: hypothetical protein FD140_2260 [Limisphaerales bacterium]